MNILITGGAGYIGRQLVYDFLKHKKNNIYIIDNLSTGNFNYLPKNIKFLKCCISNSKKIEKNLGSIKFDCLIHLAAFISVEESQKKPKKYLENNYYKSVVFIKNAIKNLKIKNFIIASTGSVYGNQNQKQFKENYKVKPSNYYAKSKSMLEKFFLNLKNKNINFCLLRFFNVAGADPQKKTGQISKKSTHLIKLICENSLKNKKLKVYGNNYNTIDGTPIRDFIHIKDLTSIIIKISEKIQKGRLREIINCGYGKENTVLNVIKTANKILLKKLNYEFVKRRSGDPEKVVANVEKLKKIINFSPRFNNLSKIIKHSYEWEKKLRNNK